MKIEITRQYDLCLPPTVLSVLGISMNLSRTSRQTSRGNAVIVEVPSRMCGLVATDNREQGLAKNLGAACEESYV